MTAVPRLRERLLAHAAALYPEPLASRTAAALCALVEPLAGPRPPPQGLFDERDLVLITYADTVGSPGVAPLRCLTDFLVRRVSGVISDVHVLPFYPSTSDDGFAVADYVAVDPALGTWDDVRALASHFGLMVDAVVNHTSASAAWFRGWLAGEPALEGFYRAEPADTDVTMVTRPRPGPVLTPFDTPGGARHVWTTFSTDQVDLDYRTPAVLLAVTEALLAYVAAGARIIRLDAIAYLWKELGTSCVHLPQTHEVVRLWRTIVDAVAPGTLLITETNVPHAENISYFGNGTDEAHLVYQFPLAPLVLSAFHLADSGLLQEWATWLDPPAPTTTYFNFLGSHDGIGVRPAEGYLTASEIRQLCDLAEAHGGGVSYRRQPDGTLSPYELNTVFFDALNPVGTPEPPAVQVDRFLAAQSILLALAGVPGIYIHALLGSRNWHEGVEQTGRLRSINRQKLDRDALDAELDTPGSMRHLVFHRFVELIRARRAEPAFHPNGPQRVIATRAPLFAFERWAPDGSSKVLCVTNLSGRTQLLEAGRGQGLSLRGALRDLLSGAPAAVAEDGLRLSVAPYQILWLREQPRQGDTRGAAP